MKTNERNDTHPLFEIETYAGFTVQGIYDVNVMTLTKPADEGEISITFTRRLGGWEPVIDAVAILPGGRVADLIRNHEVTPAVRDFWGKLADRAFRDQQALRDAARRSVLDMLGVI